MKGGKNAVFPVTISVVVPVYNAEATLAETLEALARQTFSDFEAILVDDGSTDGSPEILDRFCREDPRFRTISIPNSGAFRARLAGIDESRGRYITFCDSDDVYLADMLEKLFAQAERTGADITVCGYFRESRETGRVLAREMLGFEAGSCDFPELWDVLPMVNASLWNKLYREEILRQGIRLERRLRVGEDALFNVSLCPFLNRIAFVPEPLYRYRVRAGSVMARISPAESDGFRESLLQTAAFVRKYDGSREMEEYLDSIAFIHVGWAMAVNRMNSGGRVLDTVFSARQWLQAYFPGYRRAGKSLLWNLRHGRVQLRVLIARWIFCARLMGPALLAYRFITQTCQKEIRW